MTQSTSVSVIITISIPISILQFQKHRISSDDIFKRLEARVLSNLTLVSLGAPNVECLGC